MHTQTRTGHEGQRTPRESILLGTTNKMHRFTIFFIIGNAERVSGGFSAHHQEVKNCTQSLWYVPGLLLLPLAWLGCSSSPTTLAVAAGSLARTRGFVYSS
jgi:hypothetical protein